jgi:hypothetical protein
LTETTTRIQLMESENELQCGWLVLALTTWLPIEFGATGASGTSSYG